MVINVINLVEGIYANKILFSNCHSISLLLLIYNCISKIVLNIAPDKKGIFLFKNMM